jgi:hypothetical protein
MRNNGWGTIMARCADIQKFIALKPCFHMQCDEGHRLKPDFIAKMAHSIPGSIGIKAIV